MSRTSCSPEDRLDVTELIALLAAERDGAPWPPTSHRPRTEPEPVAARTSHRRRPEHPEPAELAEPVTAPVPTSHRLRRETPGRGGPATPFGRAAHRLRTDVDPAAARRRRIARRLAPVLVGALVLGLITLVGLLKPAPRPQLTDAALSDAAPAAADASDGGPTVPAPFTAAASPEAVAPAPATGATSTTTTSRTPSAATRARAADVAASSAASAPASPGAPGVRAVHPSCHGDAGAPKPGDVICFTSALSSPLKIDVGGTASAPIVYSGNGSTRVPGIMANADNVVIQGFVSDGADSTGIYASGTNVTVADNTITRVRHTDDDMDAIRFFGNGAHVLHNWVHDLEGNAPGDSHVDCMQTYATSRPGSSNVVIQGNRCEGIPAQCLMAEGPNADTATGKGGGGAGVSRNWLFDGNYCDAHAEAQSVAIQDIQNVTISNNTMAGAGHKAFALGQDSTGTVVRGNQIGPNYEREVGFDDDSARAGYQGPAAD